MRRVVRVPYPWGTLLGLLLLPGMKSRTTNATSARIIRSQIMRCLLLPAPAMDTTRDGSSPPSHHARAEETSDEPRFRHLTPGGRLMVSRHGACPSEPLGRCGRWCTQIPEGPDRLIGEADLATGEQMDHGGQ